MQWGDRFFGPLRGSKDMPCPPPKKNQKYFENELSQSGHVIAIPGMFNHDINHT